MLCNQLPQDTVVIFCTSGEEKEKDTKKKKSFQSMKRTGRIATGAGICLSYKQEIAKIINEYQNDRTGNKRDILNYLLCL